MTKQVVLIDSLQPVYRAAQMMSKFNAELVVVMKDMDPIGILQSKDIISQIVAMEKPLQTLIKDLTLGPLLEINSDDSIWDAADLMTTRNVRNLVVVDYNKKVIGILSTLNLLKQVSKTTLD
jgi:signal-transduction protein with cAMP-binding, CBS, and nucleotidyltransferase domain